MCSNILIVDLEKGNKGDVYVCVSGNIVLGASTGHVCAWPSNTKSVTFSGRSFETTPTKMFLVFKYRLVGAAGGLSPSGPSEIWLFKSDEIHHVLTCQFVISREDKVACAEWGTVWSMVGGRTVRL